MCLRTNAFYTNVLSLNSSYWDYKNLKPGNNDTYTAHFPYVKTGRFLPYPDQTQTNLINYEDGSYGFWGVPIPTGAMTSDVVTSGSYRRAVPLGIRFGTGVHHV